METGRTCQNCAYFFMDINDMDQGVCMNDNEVFEPFIDEITEESDFSCCYDLYTEERYEGDREACDKFEEVETIDIPDEQMGAYLTHERLKYQNVDEIIHDLYSSDKEIVDRAISEIYLYVSLENKDAFEGLLNYYLSLGPTENVEDAHMRIKIVNILSIKEPERRVLEAYVNELYRSPSNNVTRRLYTLVLERLDRCPADIVQELLLDLLNKKKYSYKMEKRILEIALEGGVI